MISPWVQIPSIFDSDIKTGWPVADNYVMEEEREGVLIAPDPSGEYPESFTFYRPKEESIHEALLDIADPEDPQEILSFVSEFGLLGTWLRGASFEKHVNPTRSVFWVANPRLRKDPLSEPYEWVHVDEVDKGAQIPSSREHERDVLYFEKFLQSDFSGEDWQRNKRIEVLGEWVGSDAPYYCNMTKQIHEFQKIESDLKDGKNLSLQEKLLPSWKPLGPGPKIPKNSEESQDKEILFQVDSLLDVGIFQLYVDQHNLRSCPECSTPFLIENKRGRNQKFCSDRCRDNRNGRRNNQRENWEAFLRNEAPEIAEEWPLTSPSNPRAKKRFQHPKDRIDDLTEQERKLASRWAQQRKKQSTRNDPDPLLEPLIAE